MTKIAKISMALNKELVRRAAAEVLQEKGFSIVERRGQGIRPWARLTATLRNGTAPIEVAVRTGSGRSVGFSRLRNGDWRTLNKVQLVLVAVPSEEDSKRRDVFAFEAKTLKRWYDRALKALQKSDREPDLDVPIFIPLESESRKNLGHSVFGMKKDAIWSASIDEEQIKNLQRDEPNDSFIERVKQEFADRNGVDVARVSVEFRIVA